MKFELPAEPVKCAWRPDKDALAACYALGKTVAIALKEKCDA